MNNESILKSYNEYNCGAVALRFAALMSGKQVSHYTSETLCYVGIDGTTHEHIVSALNELGLCAEENIGQLKPPCIVNCLVADENEIDGHYVVVIKSLCDPPPFIGSITLLIFDPLDGCIKLIEWKDFKRVWKSFRYPPDEWSVSFRLDPSHK